MSHLFLTGATGVIGSAVLPRLLADAETRVTALVRADSDEHLEQRKQKLLEFCGIVDESEIDRVRFVAGDVCQERLGLSEEAYENLSDSITAIVHSAGKVKLNQSIEIARQNACQPVMEILRLARHSPRLKKIEAVTTIGVAGRMPGLIPERRLTEPRDFHNNYEQAKSEAETLLWQAIEEGMPITIHRPSMVVGDSKTGKVASFQVFYHLCDFLTGKKTCGFLPCLADATVDIVPVDFVAEAIILSSASTVTTGRVLHLCSGPNDSVQLDRLRQTLAEIAVRWKRVTPSVRQLPLPWFRFGARVASLATKGELRRALQGLPYFLDYLAEDQAFETSETHCWLAESNVRLPPPELYLETILGNFWEASGQRRPASFSQATSLRCSSLLQSSL